MRRTVMLLWLTGVWVTLWESLTWANVIGGVVVAMAVVHLLPTKETGFRVGLNPFAALRLLFYFLWELVKASALVAWEIITPVNLIDAAVVSVRLRSRAPGIITSVASMVSLIPGTVTLEVDEENSTLFIHVFHLETIEQTRESVRRLEELTIAAFPVRRGEGAAAPGEGLA
jgi:multicomponent Na+:H+ antiporter subunit E